MACIHLLEDHVINKIAAGEVVERPTSVVKELVENAIDAGARQVTIELEDGGRRRITVRDDGAGMSRDDAYLAIKRHATSKIAQVDDLFAIASMGFRGEALASIASVSRFTLVTRRQEDAEGCKIHWQGGEDPHELPWQGSVGTSVTVEDLFFNVPARAKFLKSATAEFAQCLELIQSLALSRPQVGLSLVHNGREKLRVTAATPASVEAPARLGEAALRHRANEVWGEGAVAALLYVLESNQYGTFEALISPPGVEKATAKSLICFVNGRWVKDKVLRFGIMRGYQSHLLRGRFPQVIGHFYTDPSLVDVNVHPAKTELRFQYGGEVQGILALGVRKTLREGQWHDASLALGAKAPSVVAAEPSKASKGRQGASTSGLYPYAEASDRDEDDESESEPVAAAPVPKPSAAAWRPAKDTAAPRASVNPAAPRADAGRWRHPEPRSTSVEPAASPADAGPWRRPETMSTSGQRPAATRNFASPSVGSVSVPKQARVLPGAERYPAEHSPEPPPSSPVLNQAKRPEAHSDDEASSQPLASEDALLGKSLNEEAKAYEPTPRVTPQPVQWPAPQLFPAQTAKPADGEAAGGRIPWHELVHVGGFAQCYLFFAAADRLLVVDQHAFHERIIFERLKKQTSLLQESQALVIPEVLELDPEVTAALQERSSLLQEMGFNLAYLDEQTVEVRAVPSLLTGKNLEALCLELAHGERPQADDSSLTAAGPSLDHILATIACHSAVRAGEDLGQDEWRSLLREAEGVDFYHNCPHGRRVFKWFSKGQVERWFDR